MDAMTEEPHDKVVKMVKSKIELAIPVVAKEVGVAEESLKMELLLSYQLGDMLPPTGSNFCSGWDIRILNKAAERVRFGTSNKDDTQNEQEERKVLDLEGLVEKIVSDLVEVMQCSLQMAFNVEVCSRDIYFNLWENECDIYASLTKFKSEKENQLTLLKESISEHDNIVSGKGEKEEHGNETSSIAEKDTHPDGEEGKSACSLQESSEKKRAQNRNKLVHQEEQLAEESDNNDAEKASHPNEKGKIDCSLQELARERKRSQNKKKKLKRKARQAERKDTQEHDNIVSGKGEKGEQGNERSSIAEKATHLDGEEGKSACSLQESSEKKRAQNRNKLVHQEEQIAEESNNNDAEKGDE